MFSTVITWIGAVLGLGLLLLMAFSGFVVDLEDSMEARRQKKLAKPLSDKLISQTH